MSVRIAIDSTCDLPPEVIAEHRIAAVPVDINIGTQSDLDDAELTRADFYPRLAGRLRPGM